MSVMYIHVHVVCQATKHGTPSISL